jgi:hypothetical protein
MIYSGERHQRYQGCDILTMDSHVPLFGARTNPFRSTTWYRQLGNGTGVAFHQRQGSVGDQPDNWKNAIDPGSGNRVLGGGVALTWERRLCPLRVAEWRGIE